MAAAPLSLSNLCKLCEDGRMRAGSSVGHGPASNGMGCPGTPCRAGLPGREAKTFVPLCGGKTTAFVSAIEGPPLVDFQKSPGSTPRTIARPPPDIPPAGQWGPCADTASPRRTGRISHALRPSVRTPPGCASAVPHANGSNPSLPPLLLLSCSGHARRTASYRGFSFALPAHPGQPLGRLPAVLLEMAQFHTWPSGQIHQARFRVPGVTISGVRSPFSVGCHCLTSSGCTVVRSLKPASTLRFVQ